MSRERISIVAVVLRCVRLLCPVCGRSSIVERLFHIRHHCPVCRALYYREEGFFVGALSINVVTTEVVLLIFYFTGLLAFGLSDQFIFTFVFVAAVLFPVVFYHHSWSIWLSLDHLLETLPQHGADNK